VFSLHHHGDEFITMMMEQYLIHGEVEVLLQFLVDPVNTRVYSHN
jgi:hypothetical protein